MEVFLVAPIRFSIAALILFVVCGCVYTPGPFTQVPPGQARVLAFDREITSALGPADGALRNLLPYQTWEFDGGADETITLDVHGCGMKPLLTLLDAGGTELARDQDGSSARIEYTLPSAQRYHVALSRTVPGSRSVTTPYTLFAARSSMPASAAPVDLASPSPPPPPGSETHGIIVTGLQDIGQQPGLPPERHVFGIDEAPVFYLFGRTGRIAVSILRSGTDVYRPLAGTGSTAAPEPRRMAGYYLSAPLAPGTYCVEAPPTIAVVAAIFRIGDATQPAEYDSSVTTIYTSVAAAEGNAYAPVVTRFAAGQGVMLVARLGAQRSEGIVSVKVTDAATHTLAFGAQVSRLQPARAHYYQVGRLPRGRYAAQLMVADTVVGGWKFSVD